jgi:translation initiation factor IF-1
VPGEDAIHLEGTVVAVLREATLYRVELVNGHRLLGFVTAGRRSAATGIGCGDKVNLQMSPCDFSKGRIVLEEKENESPRVC